ncbi:MAG TPA: ATP-binding protein [Nitrospira sp.]
MESLFWQLANRTAETQFIYNLFHLLPVGLILLVLLHQLRGNGRGRIEAADWLLPLGFTLLGLHFALLTLHFGAEFFFRKELEWTGFNSLTHGLMAFGLLLVVYALLKDVHQQEHRLGRWTLRGCLLVAVFVLIDLLLSSPHPPYGKDHYSALTLSTSALILLAILFAMQAAPWGRSDGRRAILVALALMGVALFLRGAALFLAGHAGILIWNAEQHVLSVSLFAFAWAAGERSRNLLDRIFVRLNLTFIILASLIMLVTAGMEKYQYLRLAEERSMDLAEFLRGHVVYYRQRGEGLEDIFRHPEVLRRVVVEFGTLPELREVNVYLDGRRASFHYTQDWEIKDEIRSVPHPDEPDRSTDVVNSFPMTRLPIESGAVQGNQVEFVGTMDFINNYIGKYLILIYSLFTIIVGLATGIIGIIVTDTDRRLRQQYAELQETHQQLAQTAKLASVGQLAAGMAHEINNPITSILSLSSHMTEEKSVATLTASHRKSLEVIAQQAERVSKIVRNLLTFARQSRFELSRVDVDEVLNAAITLVQYRLKDNVVRFCREIDVSLPPILGDSGRLTEVFVNLLNNAIDATPRGGTVTVRAFANPPPEGGVSVEVADTGCGIAPEQLSRIFDPFFTTKEPGQGTGLGLSLSYGIVKDHGGEIRVQSQLGEGTTLVVTLPKEVTEDGAHPGYR